MVTRPVERSRKKPNTAKLPSNDPQLNLYEENQRWSYVCAHCNAHQISMINCDHCDRALTWIHSITNRPSNFHGNPRVQMLNAVETNVAESPITDESFDDPVPSGSDQQTDSKIDDILVPFALMIANEIFCGDVVTNLFIIFLKWTLTAQLSHQLTIWLHHVIKSAAANLLLRYYVIASARPGRSLYCVACRKRVLRTASGFRARYWAGACVTSGGRWPAHGGWRRYCVLRRRSARISQHHS